MEGFLRVDGTNLPGSPTNSFLADEVASTCPLLTPSPPTNDLINPLPEPTEPIFAIGDELASKLHHVQEDDKGTGDTASSSSSASAEPACTQLLNHRHTYHHITKDENVATEETTGKTQPLQLTFRNPPENYFFMTWNWPLIRKLSLWTFLAGLMAMVALVIAMIYSLPKTCNPEVEWYQGGVIYEIFPASFADSNKDMIGDLRGIYQKTGYLQTLGVKAIRLNSIFATQDYPEDYKNVTQLRKIAPQLGNVQDFVIMVRHLHSKNISVVLDLPVWPVVKKLETHLTSSKVTFKDQSKQNETVNDLTPEFLRTQTFPESFNDLIGDSILYWTNQGVDGFYLKGLENLVDDPNFAVNVRKWKKIAGPGRAIIISNDVLKKHTSNILLNNIDLVDVQLEIEKGVEIVSHQIDSIQNGTLFSKPGMPWVHWSIGNENTVRLANRLPYGNATLGATLLQLMLPGTCSIFYGDEIGLQQISDPHEDRRDLEHIHQLSEMVWPNKKSSGLSWLHSPSVNTNFDQIGLVSKMVALRAISPSIYINSISKDGDNKANAEVKYSQKDLLVVQRWYPRRKSYVVVSNLGSVQISADLSTILYSGEVLVGPRPDSKSSSISFKAISLWPGESVVILLR